MDIHKVVLMHASDHLVIATVLKNVCSIGCSTELTHSFFPEVDGHASGEQHHSPLMMFT